MGRWDELDTWVGEGLRREVFFFESRGAELFGSLYASEPLTAPLGVVICNSWGIEADQANRIVYPLAVSVAQAGGASLVFHYPGWGDSGGDPDALTMDEMAAAAVAAVTEGRRRLPGHAWMLVGLMLGASVAALAAEPADADSLLLVQPSLRPADHFRELAATARRLAAISRSGDDAVFGYRLGDPLVASATVAQPKVTSALAAFDRPGAIVRCAEPQIADEAPSHFERIELDRQWRFGSTDPMSLDLAAGEWIAGQIKRRRDLEAA